MKKLDVNALRTFKLFNEWHSSSTSKKIKAVFEVNAKAGKYLSSVSLICVCRE